MRSILKQRRRMTTTLAVGAAAALCSAGTMAAATESPPASAEQQADVAQSADFAVEYPSDGEVLDDPRPTFRGTTTGDASISLDVDGEQYAQTQAVDGSWTLTPERDLPVGVPFSITVTEAMFVDTFSHIVVQDLTVRYPQVTVDAPADGATTPGDVVVAGSSFANAMIGVSVEGETLDEPLVAGMSSNVPGEGDEQWPGTFDIEADGDWTFTPEESLPAGEYELTADASQVGADPELAESEVTSSFVVSEDEGLGTEDANVSRTHRDTYRQAQAVSGMFAGGDGERQPPIPPITVSVPVEGQEFLSPSPRFAGEGMLSADIDVTIDGETYGETIAHFDSGYWQLTPEPALPVGVRFDAVFTETWERSTGEVETDSETVPDLGVRAPRVAVTSAEHGSTVAGDAVFEGTSFPGADVEVRLAGDGAGDEWPGQLDIDEDGNWTFVPDEELSSGEYTVIAEATLDGGDPELSDSTSGTWFKVSGDG